MERRRLHVGHRSKKQNREFIKTKTLEDALIFLNLITV